MSMLRNSLASISKFPESKLFLISARTLFGKKNVSFPKDIDHASGPERIVREANARGIKDPFDLATQVRGPGTKDNPNIVKTFTGSRMIGCKCEEESSTIKFMWVHEGEPKRCQCGFWFKAVPAEKFWEDTK